jgi:hypothetical protein
LFIRGNEARKKYRPGENVRELKIAYLCFAFFALDFLAGAFLEGFAGVFLAAVLVAGAALGAEADRVAAAFAGVFCAAAGVTALAPLCGGTPLPAAAEG